MAQRRPTTILIANPSPDVYGSDLQMLESISAYVSQGYRVVVALPGDGALVAKLTERGATPLFVSFPVVRRANLSAKGLVRLGAAAVAAVPRLWRVIRAVGADLVYVNTVTIPWWIVAGRLCRRPVIAHVHEAEDRDSRMILTALNSPLTMASMIIANSRFSSQVLIKTIPILRNRVKIVHNGIAGPPSTPSTADPTTRPYRLVTICRLSPRKRPDIAIEASAILRSRGRDVTLDICGTPFAGYEWFEQQLRERSSEPDLLGHVRFLGYVSPIWPALEASNVVLAPSLLESLGNAVVEGQLAARPVVASASSGHLETVTDGETGLLVPPDDPQALADAVERLMDDPDLARAIATRGRDEAERRFSPERYSREVVELTNSVLARRGRPVPSSIASAD